MMNEEGEKIYPRIKFKTFSELQKYFDRGDILGSEEYFAWFHNKGERFFQNAKGAEMSDNITTSYKLFKATKINGYKDIYKDVIYDAECDIREYNDDTFLLYDQDQRKNMVIDNLIEQHGIDDQCIEKGETDLAFAVYEESSDLDTLRKFGIELKEKEDFGEAYIQREVRLRDVKKALEEPEEDNQEMVAISKRLAFELKNFCDGGEYGQYFDGFNTLSWECNFMGWEFKALLARDKFVASLVLSSLLSQISIRVKDKKLKGFIKIVYFDETWQFIKAGGPIVMEVIEDALRTWRKEGGILIVSTQGISEIKDQPGGEDIFNQFAYFLHMRQDNPDEIIRAGNLEGKIAEKFTKLEKASGKFSEGILMAGSTDWEKIKVITSPYTYCALAMDTDKVIGRADKIQTLVEEGWDEKEAIIEAPALLAAEL
jgi:hypothetical protein